MTVRAFFFLGLVSPGANFLVVVDSTLSHGRRVGLLTVIGAAIGDAIYASAERFGMAVLIESGGYTLFSIKVSGGIYLVWLGLRMVVRRANSGTTGVVRTNEVISPHLLFLRGLTIDLSNPKTIVFFASIFAFAVHSDAPRAARAANGFVDFFNFCDLAYVPVRGIFYAVHSWDLSAVSANI